MQQETSLRGLDDQVGKESLERRDGRLLEETPMCEGTMAFAPIATNADRATKGLREEFNGRRRCDLSCSDLDTLMRIDHAFHSPFLHLEITLAVHHACQVREGCAIPGVVGTMADLDRIKPWDI